MQIFSQKCLYAWILKAPHFKNKLLINLNKGKWQTKQQIFLQSSYSKINIQVRGTPKIFQGVECKKKITPAVRRARGVQKIFKEPSAKSSLPQPSAGRRAPSAHFSEASSFPPKSFPLGYEEEKNHVENPPKATPPFVGFWHSQTFSEIFFCWF